MDPLLVHILEGLLLAGVVASIGLQLNQRSQLVRIETLLTGADNSNGLIGDMREMKAWKNEMEKLGLGRRLLVIEQRGEAPGRRFGDLEAS